MEVKGRYCYSAKRVYEDTQAIRASGVSFMVKGFHRTMQGGSVVDTPFVCRVDEIPNWFASTGSLLVYDDIKNDLESGKMICDRPPGCNGLFFFRRESCELTRKNGEGKTDVGRKTTEKDMK